MKRIRNGKVYYTRPKRKKPEEPKPAFEAAEKFMEKGQKKIAEDFSEQPSPMAEMSKAATFGEWLVQRAKMPEGFWANKKALVEANYILGKYESYKPKMFSEPIPEKFYLPSKAQQERNSLLQNLARNVTLEDKKVFGYGYIPISWLLANLTYNEASTIVQLIDSWETHRMMTYRKPKGFFDDLKDSLR